MVQLFEHKLVDFVRPFERIEGHHVASDQVRYQVVYHEYLERDLGVDEYLVEPQDNGESDRECE